MKTEQQSKEDKQKTERQIELFLESQNLKPMPLIGHHHTKSVKYWGIHADMMEITTYLTAEMDYLNLNKQPSMHSTDAAAHQKHFALIHLRRTYLLWNNQKGVSE
ncbi:MAG: hypothetical protein FWC51_00445 [Proteobacteria bacterium]|nr:hypothetical protein [Pseudomonadota bacterium]